MSAAKADILARIRGALGPSPVIPEIVRGYRAAGSITSDGIVDLFCERVAEYKATVHRGIPAEIIPALLSGRVGVPRGFRDIGMAAIEDDDLAVAELDALDAVVTGSALAIADTGTIVLVSGELGPPRADARARPPRLHRRGGRDRASVPDAIAALAAADAEAAR